MSILPPLKAKLKTFLKSSRFRELLLNLSLLSLAWYFFHKGSHVDPNQRLHWTTRLGTKVIFDMWVTPLTPVEVTYWEGDYFTRTQRVVLTNVRSMHHYKQTPKDLLGWVW